LDKVIPTGDEVSKKQEQVKGLNSLLLDLVQAAGQASGLHGVLGAALEGAQRLVASDGVSVMWCQGDHLEVLASAGSTAPLAGLILPVSQMGAARAALDSSRAVAVDDVLEDARWQRVPGEEQVRAWLGAPLKVQDRILGVLEWTAEEPGHFDETDVGNALEGARYLAPILYRAHLLDDARLRLRELIEPRLASAPQAVDLGVELQPVVDEALDYASAHHAFLFLVDDGSQRLRCVSAAGRQRDRLMNVSLRGDGTLGGWSTPMPRKSDWLGAGPSDRDVN
jgi:transcriptional regulator with GAF, ATPase, and Fis domain